MRYFLLFFFFFFAGYLFSQNYSKLYEKLNPAVVVLSDGKSNQVDVENNDFDNKYLGSWIFNFSN